MQFQFLRYAIFFYIFWGNECEKFLYWILEKVHKNLWRMFQRIGLDNFIMMVPNSAQPPAVEATFSILVLNASHQVILLVM